MCGGGGGIIDTEAGIIHSDRVKWGGGGGIHRKAGITHSKGTSLIE